MASRVDSYFRNARSTASNGSGIKSKALRLKRLAKILKKPVEERNEEDDKYLAEDAPLIPLAELRIKRNLLLKERNVEKEDTPDELREKCQLLANEIRKSEKIVVYTGAGISTSANIPDYRGPNGVWRQLSRKKAPVRVPMADLACAQPTFTHLALTEFHKQGIVKHIVSQNCDGLHLRSGFPSSALSEVHGNMFLENCSNCSKAYWRDFDVTEKTCFHKHRTGRLCHNCPADMGNLVDTIVHFGERPQFQQPYNWATAIEQVKETDLIICLGTSLTVLRRYKPLWPKKLSSSINTKPKLVIVNLQWTCKDSLASLKINGKCDDVMKIVCDLLAIKVSEYNQLEDPLLTIAIPLKEEEESTHRRLRLSNLIKQESPSDQQQSNEAMVETSCQPGWFGKGLKVKRRRRRNK